MMGEIEEGQTSDQGKAREWVNRAVRAPRDPVWTADGITAEEWEPVSPVTGKLDAFEWRVPTSAVATRLAEPSLPMRKALEEPPPPRETTILPPPPAEG
jgi:HemY protein